MGTIETDMTALHSTYQNKLAALSQQFWADTEASATTKDPLEINGIRMSQVAVTQLKRLGLPLEWYTADELEDAVIACNADANLIDDPHGHTFQDRLYLDPEEKRARTLPALHGFHPDEYDDMIMCVQPPNIPSLPASHPMDALLPEHVKQEILAGLSLIQDPADVDCRSPLDHGLHHAPHMHHHCTMSLAA
jgi:hypothetical protein